MIECFMKNHSFSETAENNSREVRPTTSATAFVKLPTINVKSFDGKPGNWHAFMDSYKCTIDKNDTLSDIQKMNYLKSLFEGRVATIISSIKLTHKNYNICLNFIERKIRRTNN